MFTRILNYLGNIYGFIKNFKTSEPIDLASNEVREERLKICNNCPHRNDNFEVEGISVSNTPQCNICKCVLNSKVIWNDEKCDLGKW